MLDCFTWNIEEAPLHYRPHPLQEPSKPRIQIAMASTNRRKFIGQFGSIAYSAATIPEPMSHDRRSRLRYVLCREDGFSCRLRSITLAFYFIPPAPPVLLVPGFPVFVIHSTIVIANPRPNI